MKSIKSAALALALAGLTSGASAAVSGNAFIDFTSFSYSVFDTDANDGITSSLAFDSGESASNIFTNNWSNNLFSQWEEGMAPTTTIAGSAAGASVLNSDTSLQAQGALTAPSGSIHHLSAQSVKSTLFTLTGPGAVTFKVNYTIDASDNDVHDSFFSQVGAGLYGSVNFDDNTDSSFASQQMLSSGSKSGVLKVTFFSDGSSASGSLSMASTIELGQTAPVPEPSEYLMFLAGLGVVGYAVRRRQR